VADTGVVYLPVATAAWLSPEPVDGYRGLIYATVDFPDALQDAIEAVNANLLELVDLCCTAPAEVVLFTTTFPATSSPPAFFNRWTRKYNVEAVRRLHAAANMSPFTLMAASRGAADDP